MKASSHVICHLPPVDKADLSDLAYARRISVSRLVRELVRRELSAARVPAKRKRRAA